MESGRVSTLAYKKDPSMMSPFTYEKREDLASFIPYSLPEKDYKEVSRQHPATLNIKILLDLAYPKTLIDIL